MLERSWITCDDITIDAMCKYLPWPWLNCLICSTDYIIEDMVFGLINNMPMSTTGLFTSGACFFYARIRLNPTTNTPIPDLPTRLYFLAQVAIHLPDSEASIWSPDVPDIDRTGVRTVLCTRLLLICHHSLFVGI